MYDTLLFLHFLGVSIGAGTGVYMLALGRHAARNMDQAEARTLMPGIAAAVSRVGYLGLLLLVSSGVAMGLILGEGVLTATFQAKMLLVLLLVGFIMLMNRLAVRARRSADGSAARAMRKLALLGPVLGGLIILTAVMSFH